MDIEEEKRLIYGLMRQIFEERRELSKAYFELKEQLKSLNEKESSILSSQNILNQKSIETPLEQRTEESIEVRKHYVAPVSTKKRSSYPLERIAGYVTEVLKKEGIPLRPKVIHEKLESDYGIYIGYANLTNNILRKMINLDKYSIEKAARGFYQYRKKRGIE